MQNLKKFLSDYYHIVTPSNGVTSLLKHISKIDFDKYKKFYLFLDNDEPGNNATEKIIEKYPIFEKFTLNSDCKDFNEHYIKYLKDKYEKNTKMPN
ncbi:toprim domain-containing protein [bacterium]|nr:toprim domain-containing protein [bacterium]